MCKQDDGLTAAQRMALRATAVELAHKVIYNSSDMGRDLLIYAQVIEHFLLTGEILKSGE